ncbi:MAG: 3-methylitaconate isomerase [Spirochaetales bacterium]|nr:3-methylitaconate isomerase [Spirochaetales bacterium]
MIEIPCTIMRGGTSKGLFFLDSDLPRDREERYRLISRAFGSPDPSGLQINGLGGTLANMNKLAIISKREGEKNAVNYDFGQIDIYSWIIDTKANCGNISSAVGPFAIDHGLVDEITEPITQVMIYNTNTKKFIRANVPVKDGKTLYEGDFRIAGINRPGARIQLDFLEPGGATTGKLLPTGNVIDRVRTVHYGEFDISCVDATNPFVFARAGDLGLKGNESPKEIEAIPGMLDKMLEIREAAAVLLGFASTLEEAHNKVKAVPKFCMVAPAQDYVSVADEKVARDDVDLLVRMLSMGKALPSLAITGAICIGVAAKIKGCLVNEAADPRKADCEQVRIGQPGGMLPVSVKVEQLQDGSFHAIQGSVFRTARRMMSGTAYIPEND